MPLRGQDAWRRAPIFRWGLTDALPGLREGAAAFGLFAAISWAAQAMGGSDDSAHHGAAAHAGSHETAAAASSAAPHHH